MLVEVAPNRRSAGLALARISHMEYISETQVQQLRAKANRYGVNVQLSDIPVAPPGPPTVHMPSGWQDLETLGYITPVANLESIEQRGILSFKRARRITHFSIADTEIQDVRHHRDVRGKDLHSYVNLFINPRNAMLSRVISEQGIGNICVVEVAAPSVFALPDVLVTERNAAARSFVRFWPGAGGLLHLDRTVVFAESWYQYGKEDRDTKQRMMAEVLVPDSVPPSLLTGVVVVHSKTAHKLRTEGIGLPISSDQHLFFA